MHLFDGIADTEPCALHAYCLRSPLAVAGPEICALCARLDHRVLADKIEQFIATATNRPQPGTEDIQPRLSGDAVRQKLLAQVGDFVQERRQETERVSAAVPKRYVCYTQYPGMEEWRIKYRPRSLTCRLGS
jgi:hypothetical protein